MRAPYPSRRRPPRRRRRGFSIVEALVAAAVLGIGLIAMVKLHQSAMRGMKASREVGIATDIATQAAEELVAMPVGQLPACPTPGGCKANANQALALDFAAPKPGCTFWTADGLMRDRTGARDALIQTTEATAVGLSLPFRVDQVVTAHPNANQHPGTNIVQIFVCWRDEQGYVRQVTTSRVVQ